MKSALTGFSVGCPLPIISIHGRNLDPVYVTSTAVTVLCTENRQESMTGTARVILFPKASINFAKAVLKRGAINT